MSAPAGAAAAAIAQAIRASGVIVRVAPEEFQNVLRKGQELLVVYAVSGFFSSNHQ